MSCSEAAATTRTRHEAITGGSSPELSLASHWTPADGPLCIDWHNGRRHGQKSSRRAKLACSILRTTSVPRGRITGGGPMRPLARSIALVALLACPAFAQDKSKPAPDFADVTYGPHERHVFDLWRPKGDGPFPLVLYIHGGGFMAGDKKSISGPAIQAYLGAGWAVAAVNYRFTNVAPAPAQYLDCA